MERAAQGLSSAEKAQLTRLLKKLGTTAEQQLAETTATRSGAGK